mmetsp:Transcript_42407/g.111734  ORF Transcript_42407/g.111734 Transcript_42407/m.111734 type:complete len:391 (-) Transcript_42407:13-1185(-)
MALERRLTPVQAPQRWGEWEPPPGDWLAKQASSHWKHPGSSPDVSPVLVKWSRPASCTRRDSGGSSTRAPSMADLEHQVLELRQRLSDSKQENARLLNELRLRTDLEDALARTEEERDHWRKQASEMTQFLADYGLVWVGSDGSPPSDNDGSSAVDMEAVKQSVEELNQLCDAPTQIVSRGNVHHFDVSQGATVTICFFRDGLLVQGYPFWPYSADQARRVVSDIMDGYFPSVLQKSHPDGVELKIQDKRHSDYSLDARSWLKELHGAGNHQEKGEPGKVGHGGVAQAASVIDCTDGTDGPAAVVQVRFDPAFGPGRLVFKLLAQASVKDLRQAITTHGTEFVCDAFSLRSNLPPHTFPDHSATLEHCNLTPNGTVFVTKQSQGNDAEDV